MRRLALATTLVLFLAGCSVGAEQPAPQPPSTPAPATEASLPDIPIVSGELAAPREPRPPVRVEVPAAGVQVAVTPVGVRTDGLMELPDDVTVAGWYRYGPDPLSESGTTVISAHVDSARYGLGPFSRLIGLPVGAEIIVTVEGGRQVSYVVESVTSIPKRDVPLAEIFNREGDSRLVLITCGGQFDREAFRYSDNVIVVATPARS